MNSNETSAVTLREAIDRGHAARRAGRLEEALTLYGRALELAPSDAEASSLYGLVLLNLGKPAEARAATSLTCSRLSKH